MTFKPESLSHASGLVAAMLHVIVKRQLVPVSLVCVSVAATSCSHDKVNQISESLPDLAYIAKKPVSPAKSTAVESVVASGSAGIEREVFYRGVKGSISGTHHDEEFLSQKISLAFVNAPAADVTQAIIGELLGQTVAIADGVSGTITLSSPNPVPARDALAALEAVLAQSGIALIRLVGRLINKVMHHWHARRRREYSLHFLST